MALHYYIAPTEFLEGQSYLALASSREFKKKRRKYSAPTSNHCNEDEVSQLRRRRRKRRGKRRRSDDNVVMKPSKCKVKTRRAQEQKEQKLPKANSTLLLLFFVFISLSATYKSLFSLHSQNALGYFSIQLASATNQVIGEETQLGAHQETTEDLSQPQAQPLIFNLLHELGSGDGFGVENRPKSNSRHLSAFSTADSSSVSPALIEARCWNNYDNDNDCKQLNVITAPQAGEDSELLRNRLLQQQTTFASSSDSDNIITPIVIFEASSTIKSTATEANDNEIEANNFGRQFVAQPPYQASSNSRANSNERTYPSSGPISQTGNDIYGAPPQTATILLPTRPVVEDEAPATRPSLSDYFASPKSAADSRKSHTTTVGRRCRDENDADCDEPDEVPDVVLSSSSERDRNRAGQNEDDEDDSNHNDEDSAGMKTALPVKSNKHDISTATSLPTPIESGSGGGFAPTDDNDDSNDDDDDGDDDNDNNDSNSDDADSSDSVDSSSGNSINGSDGDSTTADSRLLEVSSVFPHPSNGPIQRPATGAEIEVVVHSTLPPSFPSKQTHSDDRSHTSTSTSTTTTTILPDETFTSKPIFPSSTTGASLNSLGSNDEHIAGLGSDERDNSGQNTASTTEIDLYTFRPIPIPVDLPQTSGGSGNQNSNPNSSNQQRPGQDAVHQDKQQEVSQQHIHEPVYRKPASNYEGRGAFDEGWTTRRPLNVHSQLAQAGGEREQVGGGQQDAYLMSGKRTGAGKAHHVGTDMLPTLLLFASVIVLVFTALIFLVMAFIFWRRNTIRRRALLQKAHLLNGPQPPHAPMMAASMSHASQLMHGNVGSGFNASAGGGQQGLLSTYAAGKGSSPGKVTTSLVKPSGGETARLLNGNSGPTEIDEENDGDEDEDDTNGSDNNNKSNSKEQIGRQVGDLDEGSAVLEQSFANGADSRVAMARGRVRQRLANLSGPQKQSSWSTDEPTTSSSGNGGGRSQDSRRQYVGGIGPAQANGSQAKGAHYPNSLSDGRQNSSSISDSQCSPDGTSIGPAMSMAGPIHQQQCPQQIAGPSHMMQPLLGPQYPLQQQPFRPMYPVSRAESSVGGMLSSPVQSYPVRVPPQQLQNGFSKSRFISSKSTEDLHYAQHGINHMSQQQQQQVPYLPHQQQSQHVILPHLISARSGGQFVPLDHNQPVGEATMQPLHQQAINPQRIAMNPLATLSRRYPPNAGLNRNIYSEDSSSFMTTSPSLARTSSSSSFAFNMAKHMPSPVSSIKAKPMIDASGRMINNYTPEGLFDGQSNTSTCNGTPNSGPLVLGQRDRSEAWYV